MNPKKPRSECLWCGVLIGRNSNKFCSQACDHRSRWAVKKSKIETGLIVDPRDLRKYFIEKHGNTCWNCKLTTWCGLPIPLVLDHIDGNPNNWGFDNLRMLCCNCDGLTSTYKARNKGFGRAYRRVRYANGQSY